MQSLPQSAAAGTAAAACEAHSSLVDFSRRGGVPLATSDEALCHAQIFVYIMLYYRCTTGQSDTALMYSNVQSPHISHVQARLPAADQIMKSNTILPLFPGNGHAGPALSADHAAEVPPLVLLLTESKVPCFALVGADMVPNASQGMEKLLTTSSPLTSMLILFRLALPSLRPSGLTVLGLHLPFWALLRSAMRREY